MAKAQQQPITTQEAKALAADIVDSLLEELTKQVSWDSSVGDYLNTFNNPRNRAIVTAHVKQIRKYVKTYVG